MNRRDLPDRLSSTTKASYLSRWRDFEQWCSYHAVDALPAAPEAFIAYLLQRARYDAPPTLRGRIAAVKSRHERENLPSPTEDPMVRLALDGLQRLVQEEESEIQEESHLFEFGSELIDRNSARSIVPPPDGDSLTTRDRALLLLAMSAGLSPSEIVRLDVDDVETAEQEMRLAVRHRTGTDTILVGSHQDLRFCPVRAMQGWLSILSSRSGPLFRSVSRHGKIGRTRLNPNILTRVARRRASESGARYDDRITARDIVPESYRSIGRL